MLWFRIDNRLVHGQIIEAWLPYTRATRLLVANDALADDELQQQIVSLAIPGRVEVMFARLDALARHCTGLPAGGHDTLVLFATCADARRAFDAGVGMHVLNVGNLHYTPGKKQICAHVSISDDDEACLRFFSRHSVALDFRCVPSEPVQIKGWS